VDSEALASVDPFFGFAVPRAEVVDALVARVDLAGEETGDSFPALALVVRLDSLVFLVFSVFLAGDFFSFLSVLDLDLVLVDFFSFFSFLSSFLVFFVFFGLLFGELGPFVLGQLVAKWSDLYEETIFDHLLHSVTSIQLEGGRN